jgi:hypothetical protein
MSLFGAKKPTESLKDVLKRAKENYEKKMGSGTQDSVTSGIGEVLDRHNAITGVDPEGTATTSEIAREGHEDEEQLVEQPAAVTLPREVFNQAVRIHNAEARETGHLSQVVEPVWGPAKRDKYGRPLVEEAKVYTISSDDSSLSPPPTTSYRGSDVSFPAETPRATTVYEGSIVGFPPSAIPLDPFSTPRLSGSGGIIAQRYIQSEENTGKNATEESEEEEGMGETLKGSTPIPRKFEISDSEDEAMTEVEWRDEEPYMTPTKKGKKRNKGKGVERPVTPERPIPNMPQTPSRRKLESDWAKPAGRVTNEEGAVDLEAFFGEYLRNTNGLRDFMATNQLHDERYDEWCLKQAEHMAARQNHTDAEVKATRKLTEKVLTEVDLSREYDEVRADKLDQRLEKIEKKVAKLAPVNMAKTIENAMSSCMEKMVDQLTDRVVKRFRELEEELRKKDEIRRGKQVEATPEEEEMSDIEFEPGATFSQEENEKVEKVIRAEMEVDEQRLEQSKHAPVIPPGGVRQEFPSLEVGQVTILKKKPMAPAVPQQKKKEVKKPEVKEVPKGPKAGGKKPEVKKPEVKKPEGKKPEEKKKDTWAQRAVAPSPPKKNPGQAQQQQRQGENKKKGDGFTEVKRQQQKKEEMRPVPPGQNTMEKRRVTF